MTRASGSRAMAAVLVVLAMFLAACGAEGGPTTGVVGAPVEATAVATSTPSVTPTSRPVGAETTTPATSTSASPTSAGTASVAPSKEASADPAESAGAGVAAGSLLDDLKVRPTATGGYDRKLFRHWVDADGDGCDTRAEVLIRQSARPASRTSTCRVLEGRWISVYDDRVLTDATELDIDHLVPLAEAWRSGAHRWDAATRRSFANDLDYGPALIAVSASTNRSKGDRPPQEWMPPSSAHGCDYVGEWTATKWRWQLSVTAAEKRHLRQKIESCGGVRVAKPTKARVGTGPDLSGSTTKSAKPKAPSSTKAPGSTKAPKSKAPKSTKPKAPSVSGPVHPGAFCAPAGARGQTRTGTKMTCKSTATDTRNRWRAA